MSSDSTCTIGPIVSFIYKFLFSVIHKWTYLTNKQKFKHFFSSGKKKVLMLNTSGNRAQMDVPLFETNQIIDKTDLEIANIYICEKK